MTLWCEIPIPKIIKPCHLINLISTNYMSKEVGSVKQRWLEQEIFKETVMSLLVCSWNTSNTNTRCLSLQSISTAKLLATQGALPPLPAPPGWADDDAQAALKYLWSALHLLQRRSHVGWQLGHGCHQGHLPVGTARGGSGGLLPPPAELDPSQLLPGPQGKLRDRRQTSFIIISGLQEELRIQIYQSAHLRIQIYLSAYLFIYLSITQESLICLIAQKCLQGSILWQFFNTSGSCLSLKSHYLLKYISTYPNISTLFCADFVCCLFCLFLFLHCYNFFFCSVSSFKFRFRSAVNIPICYTITCLMFCNGGNAKIYQPVSMQYT